MLRGKGLWAYRKKELDRAIQIAPQMGATHVLYKVGQGSDYYPGMAQAAQKITAAGLIPFGWTWLMLDDPQAEARVAVRAFQDGFQGFIFDTESEECRNRFEQAVQLGGRLRDAGLDFDKLYNCSFPNISHHRDLPYDQMNEYCKGGLMPMSYGSFFAPESTVPPDQQAQRVIDEWTYGHYEYWCRHWGYCPPLYPILGPYHDEYGRVRMPPDEFQIWLDRLAAHSPAFFSIFTAAVINNDLLPLIHACPLGKGVEPILTAERVQVVSPELGYLRVRWTPSTEQPPLTHVYHGDVLEALDAEQDVRAKVGQRGQWLRIRVSENVEGYVAAWYLRLPEVRPVSFDIFGTGPVSAEVKMEVQVVSSEMGFLNVRPVPSTDRPPITRVDDGAVLEALELEEDVRARVGREAQWLHVRTPEGIEGYVAAWYLRLHKRPKEAVKAGLQVEVVSPEVGYLNVRPIPSTKQSLITQVDDGDVLESIAPEAETRAKVGQQGQWLHIRTSEGVAGYVAAWYLRLHEEEEEEEEEEEWVIGEPIPHLVVHSDGGLNVRRKPGTDLVPAWHVVDKTVLEVIEDPKKVGGKVGKDRWLKIRTPSLHEGYVNGLYVRAKRSADERKPVDDAALPRGECAWIFGIHAAGATTPADFRFLFQGKHKTGWVLFTEAIGADPHGGGGHDYTPWSNDGYGVLVRLNHGYEPGGTIPVRAKYPDFAQACARYVQNSRGCRIWIIGNEQNNVREHPGGVDKPIEHITPQLFAEAFNLARQRIKQVQPEAIVVPGAVDPYNTYPWAKMDNRRNRPLEYFKEMLDHIDDLDGISLHTYTHWLDVGLITQKSVFQDEFLQPGTSHEHYYDFQAYRPFAEAIPAKWRDRPVYITESNHWLALEHQPRNPGEERKVGWVNKDRGWVQAAYAEIHRWNSTPHAQQIHCFLLYRWTGDEWAIEKAGGIQKDFKKALNHDYRWRR